MGKVLSDEYDVKGDAPFFQVSPEASFWSEEPVLRPVTHAEVFAKLNPNELEYPASPTAEEIAELTTGEFSYAKRYVEFPPENQTRLGEFLTHPAFIARPPTGTVINNRIGTGRLPIVKNGAELATLFEAEKTAVWHQHVLLTLLDLPGDVSDGQSTVTVRLREVISPVRQALMQAALHLATYSALTAIWRFKWRSTPAEAASDPSKPELRLARRQRPAEYFGKVGGTPTYFQTLYDSEIRFNANGDILRDVEVVPRRPPGSPATMPGTPRHPAYGSGHSTYSKAASEILKVFLPKEWGRPNIPGGMIRDIPGNLDKLANSIGESRFWGGVHWREDHNFGQRVGKTVADLLIEQLNQSLVNPAPSTEVQPPDRQTLETWFQQAQQKPQPRWDWRADGPFPKKATTQLNIQGGRVDAGQS
jgi:hypothetical protein